MFLQKKYSIVWNYWRWSSKKKTEKFERVQLQNFELHNVRLCKFFLEGPYSRKKSWIFLVKLLIFLIIQKIFFFHIRALSQTYGLWDTVRVDGGKVFNLTVFMQPFLSHMRNDTSRLPIHRGRSTVLSCFIFRYFKF